MIQNNNCKVIGITGGISTGKSTVSNILKDKGYKVIDADVLARRVVEVGEPAYIKIVEEFGDRVLFEDGSINRKILASIIFNDIKFREKLNNITHLHIFESIKLELSVTCKEEKTVFLDIPLLFEQFDLWGEYGIEFDEILLVYTNSKTQLQRLMKRDNISRGDALKKIEAQMSMDEKLRRSSKIIDNSGDFEDLKKEVEKLLLELI